MASNGSSTDRNGRNRWSRHRHLKTIHEEYPDHYTWRCHRPVDHPYEGPASRGRPAWPPGPARCPGASGAGGSGRSAGGCRTPPSDEGHMHDRDRARTTGADKDRAAGRQAAAGPPVVRAGRRRSGRAEVGARRVRDHDEPLAGDRPVLIRDAVVFRRSGRLGVPGRFGPGRGEAPTAAGAMGPASGGAVSGRVGSPACAAARSSPGPGGGRCAPAAAPPCSRGRGAASWCG